MTDRHNRQKGLATEDSSIDAAAEMSQIRDSIRSEALLGRPAMSGALDDRVTQARSAWNVQPLSFQSSVPVIGSFIAALRTAWNSVATKWQIRHVLDQQNRFNLIVYRSLGDLAQAAQTVSDKTDWLSQVGQQLVEQVDGVSEQLEELELRLLRIRRLVSATTASGPSEAAPVGGSGPRTAPSSTQGDDYLGFNVRFTARGSVVRQTYRQYLPLFANRVDVLDAGCGRGHFLELLQEIGVEGYGVDRDADMVEICRLKGLRAQVADAMNHLAELPSESLGGVFSGHLIEHLAPAELHRFLALARRSLRPGGVLVCETPNTRSLFVLANTYYRDLTHQQPVHPETYQFMAQAEGFVEVELRYSHSVPDHRAVGAIELPERADPDLKTTIQEINARLRRIDEEIFGCQNVALIAHKADRASRAPK